jgi:hypothetical protein
LVVWTAGGTAASYVNKYEETKDRCAAHSAMQAQFDGRHKRESKWTKAQALLDRLTVHHETNWNSLESFCQKMTQASDNLKECREIVLECTKVQNLLNKNEQSHIALKLSVLNDNEATSLFF